MTQHTVFFGQGAQIIRWAPRDQLGRVRVTSSTYTIVDLREDLEGTDRVVQAAAPAVVGAISTTLGAAAGPATANPRELLLSSPTLAIERGRIYSLGGDVTRSVEVADLDPTGTIVTLSHELGVAFPAGATFLDVELQATFPALVADDQRRFERAGGPFQILWDYTIDGERYLTPQIVWITRYGVVPWVMSSEVIRHYPTMATRSGQRVDASGAILAATDDVLAQVAAGDRDIHSLRENLAATMAVRYKALWYLLIWQQTDSDSARAESFDAMYREQLANLLIGVPPLRTVTVDHDDETAPQGSDRSAGRYIFTRG